MPSQLPAVIKSGSQRFAVFAQQIDALDPLLWQLLALAATLLVLGVAFIGINSYALYWMLKQQREAIDHG